MGIGVMLIVLLIVVILLIICNIRMVAGDLQMAADSLADGVAVFVANEGGEYEDACDKAEEIRQLLESETGIILDAVALDEDALENNEAKITVMSTGTVEVDGMGIPNFSYVLTKSAGTKFTKRTSMSSVYGVNADIDYVQWAIDIANDNSHGYCRADVYQGTGHPDYDCSYLVSSALRQFGYISYGFSTSSEYSALTGAGFTCLPYNESQLLPGDILHRGGHTEIYVGNGWTVGAHQSEDASQNYNYGRPGDQTGQEISVSLNGPGKGWTRIFRLTRSNDKAKENKKGE